MAKRERIRAVRRVIGLVEGLIDTFAEVADELAVNRLQSLTPPFSDNSTGCRADRRSDPTPNDIADRVEPIQLRLSTA
jgi:hypothetical protein